MASLGEQLLQLTLEQRRNQLRQAEADRQFKLREREVSSIEDMRAFQRQQAEESQRFRNEQFEYNKQRDQVGDARQNFRDDFSVAQGISQGLFREAPFADISRAATGNRFAGLVPVTPQERDQAEYEASLKRFQSFLNAVPEDSKGRSVSFSGGGEQFSLGAAPRPVLGRSGRGSSAATTRRLEGIAAGLMRSDSSGRFVPAPDEEIVAAAKKFGVDPLELAGVLSNKLRFSQGMGGTPGFAQSFNQNFETGTPPIPQPNVLDQLQEFLAPQPQQQLTPYTPMMERPPTFRFR